MLQRTQRNKVLFSGKMICRFSSKTQLQTKKDRIL